MEYQFEVINKDGGNTLWNSLWIPIPNTTNYQYNIDLTEITPEPSKIYTDPEHNNTVLYYENAPAVISGSCEYSRKPPFAFDVDPQKIGQYDKNSPLYKLYTRSETWIEADAPEIASKAEEIVEGLDNPYAKAQHIHDFVCNYLTPEQIPWTTPEEYFDAYGALATYKRGSGTCHNYALVFVALCRAEGIPARTVHGINFFEGLLGEKIGIEDWSHAWAEFYLPEYGWITVDPSQNQFAEVSNLRLAYSMGNNITLNPPCNSPDTWYCHAGTAMSLGYTVPFTEERITIEKSDPEKGNNLYFPHVASDGQWKTEIAVVNKSSGQVAGTLAAYDGDGNKLDEKSLELSGHARRALVVGEAFPDPDEIRYMVFSADSADSADVCGYTKFCQEGKYRVAVPAVRERNRDAIHVPHIASNDAWWTGLALVNTTDTEKTLTIRFDTGPTEQVTMAPGAQKSFSIRKRLGAPQPDIKSAEIEGGEGVIGLELFGHKKEPQLSGVLLRDQTAENLYFPHVASNDTWWTGICAYNPGNTAAELDITAYSEGGEMLSTDGKTLDPNGKYINPFHKLDLDEDSAWFQIEASSPINGFELFGTNNGKMLAGYTAVNIKADTGVFPKLEEAGWTGIAFVNMADSRADVTLRAYNEGGTLIAEEPITVCKNCREVDNPEKFFGDDISAATYLTYSSSEPVVAFQLNGSSEDMMLDGLPGM